MAGKCDDQMDETVSTSDLPHNAPEDNSFMSFSSEEDEDCGGGKSEENDTSHKSIAASIDRFVDSVHETVEDESPLALLESSRTRSRREAAKLNPDRTTSGSTFPLSRMERGMTSTRNAEGRTGQPSWNANEQTTAPIASGTSVNDDASFGGSIVPLSTTPIENTQEQCLAKSFVRSRETQQPMNDSSAPLLTPGSDGDFEESIASNFSGEFSVSVCSSDDDDFSIDIVDEDEQEAEPLMPAHAHSSRVATPRATNRKAHLTDAVEKSGAACRLPPAYSTRPSKNGARVDNADPFSSYYASESNAGKGQREEQGDNKKDRARTSLMATLSRMDSKSTNRMRSNDTAVQSRQSAASLRSKMSLKSFRSNRRSETRGNNSVSSQDSKTSAKSTTSTVISSNGGSRSVLDTAIAMDDGFNVWRNKSETKKASQLIDDIETCSGSTRRRRKQFCSRLNSTKTRKCCAAYFLLVGVVTVGTLYGLGLMPTSTSDRPVDETLVVDPPTPSPSERFYGPAWYVDWTSYQCRQDCEGPSPCGGFVNSWDQTFPTLELCCTVNFESYINKHWTLEQCKAAATASDSPIATDYPTWSPHASTSPTESPIVTQASVKPQVMYFADYESITCIEEESSGKQDWDIGYPTYEDCCEVNFSFVEDSPCNASAGTMEKSQIIYYADWETRKCKHTDSQSQYFDQRFASGEECCQDSFSWDPTRLCFKSLSFDEETVAGDSSSHSKQEEEVADNTDDSKYYADFSKGECLPLDELDEEKSWQKVYSTEAECCAAHFSWDVNGLCYEKVDVSIVENRKYYANFVERRCETKHTSETSRWDTGYSTREECCETNFSWDTDGPCFDDDVELVNPFPEDVSPPPSTTRPSAGPTYSPSEFLTYMPTEMPSKTPSVSPTPRPSLSPVIPGTPTGSPQISPSVAPSVTSTDLPSSSPTISSSNFPSMPPSIAKSSVPSASPTDDPTAEPTQSKLDALKAVLLPLSPNSLESLDDDDSDQYRAMEWLVKNESFDSFSTEKIAQRWSLATLYESFYGKEWKESAGWLRDRGEYSDECSWQGIVCGDLGSVTRIELKGNSLWGGLPPEISLLDNLEYLGLSENEIKEIPAEVFKLERLKVLDLEKNLIETLPEVIVTIDLSTMGTSISPLEELYLSYNKLDSIPSSLFQLSTLKVLWASNNKLSEIPMGIGALTSLEDLDLEGNRIAGSIPNSLFNLPKLRSLYLHDNMLTGQLAPSMTRLSKLEILDLDSNSLSGAVSPRLGLFPQLTQLHLGKNEFEGQLPWNALSRLSNLTVLDVSYNRLNSTISTQIGGLSNLVSIRLDNNYHKNENGKVTSFGIKGSIPSTIGLLHKLQELRLDDNYVSGSIPNSMQFLQNLLTFRAESNNLKGAIPPMPANLQYLHLWSNYLTGTISGQLGTLRQLQELFLDDNDLTGTIPLQLGYLTSASYISFAQNQLRGPLPPSFGGLASLKRLDLYDNKLTGAIPSQLANAPLAKLKLEGNLFHGDIPQPVCDAVDSISGDCATTSSPTPSPGSDQFGFTVARESAYRIWWSCSCCSSCS
mmetsp:Transcript_8179/g.19193  ORF Transcript_8179/g.19193 Transcript_8179/m.19193 type:complete len:1555 (-) Transcript_8179:52-4716(-)